ncbi:MAG TPA: ATP cone domain-containing protein [Gemmataceae bacterium]|nr:ATP cone domain-containing protein [Gemmataceae bacterium]
MFEPSRALPPWVKKRDGRVVPFDPDAIGQDLFAAAEALGQADPFLTRELTDGVLHFLAADCPDNIPGTEWIAELVVKVVRELRQPRLAQAFAERGQAPEVVAVATAPSDTPAEVVRRSLETYSLDAVFSRDLAAAHREGLLVLGGLAAPRELTAAVLTPPEPSATLPALQLLDAVLETRGGVAGWLALDGAEYIELEKGSPPLPRLLAPVLQAAGLTARLHLNVCDPPPWAVHAAQGPLFAEQIVGHKDAFHAAAAVVEAVLHLDRQHCPFAIDWHLSERDFAASADTNRGELLEAMVRAALGDYPVTFVFNRPRRLMALGPGLDRLHACLLMTVGLNLTRLLEHTGISDDVELFLRKVASLARLAVSAGVQKRQYLRGTLHETGGERSFLQRGFLLDRARLLISPLGLDGAVRLLTGAGMHQGKTGLDLARRVLQTLEQVLEEEGKRRLVDCGLEITEDLTGAKDMTPTGQQLTVVGRLHAVTGRGTVVAALGEDERLSVDHVVRLLEFAWRHTEVACLRFQPRPAVQQQPTLLG